MAGSGAVLLVGAFETDHDELVEFDMFVATRDQPSLAKQLNSQRLPWIELLTSEFDYEMHLTKFPKNKTTLEGCVPPDDLPHIKMSKTRYIVFNQSKSKRGRELMNRLAILLAAKSNGVVAKHSKPK